MTLVRELDTFPDFMHFLDFRRFLIENEKTKQGTHDLDLLGFYKARPDMVEDLRKERLSGIVIEPGSGKSYFQDHAEDRERRDYLNHPSYLVDFVIDTLHQSVGFHPRMEDPDGDYDDDGVAEGTVAGYIEVIQELASLGRVHRRSLGEVMLEKMERANTKRISYGVFMDPNTVVATALPRDKRRNAMLNIAAAAVCAMIAKKISIEKMVCIATNELAVEERSLDTMILLPKDFHPEERVRFEKLGRDMFMPLSRGKAYEFGEPPSSKD
jgi:hypothetical protein